MGIIPLFHEPDDIVGRRVYSEDETDEIADKLKGREYQHQG